MYSPDYIFHKKNAYSLGGRDLVFRSGFYRALFSAKKSWMCCLYIDSSVLYPNEGKNLSIYLWDELGKPIKRIYNEDVSMLKFPLDCEMYNCIGGVVFYYAVGNVFNFSFIDVKTKRTKQLGAYKNVFTIFASVNNGIAFKSGDDLVFFNRDFSITKFKFTNNPGTMRYVLVGWYDRADSFVLKRINDEGDVLGYSLIDPRTLSVRDYGVNAPPIETNKDESTVDISLVNTNTVVKLLTGEKNISPLYLFASAQHLLINLNAVPLFLSQDNSVVVYAERGDVFANQIIKEPEDEVRKKIYEKEKAQVMRELKMLVNTFDKFVSNGMIPTVGNVNDLFFRPRGPLVGRLSGVADILYVYPGGNPVKGTPVFQLKWNGRLMNYNFGDNIDDIIR